MALITSKGGSWDWKGSPKDTPPRAPKGQTWVRTGISGGNAAGGFGSKVSWSLVDNSKLNKGKQDNKKEDKKTKGTGSKGSSSSSSSTSSSKSSGAPKSAADFTADYTKKMVEQATAPQESLDSFRSKNKGLAYGMVKEFLGKDIGTDTGDLAPGDVDYILSSLHARGVSGKELPSAFENYLTSSPKYQEFIKSDQQRSNEYTYGNMGRDDTGKLTNTFSSVLASNAKLQGMYDLQPDKRMSINDIKHLQGVDLQNVVNAGMEKITNIEATSKLMGLIGYAFG
jgi:hypothetical protein